MLEGNRKAMVLIALQSRLERDTRRVSSQSQSQRDAELALLGWQRRFVTDAERAEEALELYRKLGFEVLVEAVQMVESDEDCQTCLQVRQHDYRTIYTRKRGNDDNANGNTQP